MISPAVLARVGGGDEALKDFECQDFQLVVGN
jgi:hypothetical protein